MLTHSPNKEIKVNSQLIYYSRPNTWGDCGVILFHIYAIAS